MPKMHYKSIRFREATLKVMAMAEHIINEYVSQGYRLTLRQLYYQFVARGLLANQQREYDRLGTIISDARLSGLIDWDAIEDRTRFVRSNAHWDTPAEIVQACSEQYMMDKWRTQKYRIEVWIEKDALVGVVENACVAKDVPYFSCRGYVSQSEMWNAAQRFIRKTRPGQVHGKIIHLGDHDPSGIDMTRDIQDRMDLFGARVEVIRVALNMDQVEQYKPPPNPAKVTDSRFEDYWANYGDECWELDAIEPAVLEKIIASTIDSFMDTKKWEAIEKQEKHGRKQIEEIGKHLTEGR